MSFSERRSPPSSRSPPPPPATWLERFGEWVGRLIVVTFVAWLIAGRKTNRVFSRWFLGLALILPLLPALQRLGTREKPTSLSLLSRVAAEANKGLPKMADADTQVVRMEALEGVLIYQNRLVNHSAAQLDSKAFQTAAKQMLQKSLCNTPATRDGLLKVGVTMRYVYHDKADALLTTVDIRPADCGFQTP